jgi:hypothetical protein
VTRCSTLTPGAVVTVHAGGRWRRATVRMFRAAAASAARTFGGTRVAPSSISSRDTSSGSCKPSNRRAY